MLSVEPPGKSYSETLFYWKALPRKDRSCRAVVCRQHLDHSLLGRWTPSLERRYGPNFASASKINYFSENFAPINISPETNISHKGSEPLHAPDHPEKMNPVSGIA